MRVMEEFSDSGGKKIKLMSEWGLEGVQSVRGVGRWQKPMRKDGTVYRKDTESVNNKTMLIIRGQLKRVWESGILGGRINI